MATPAQQRKWIIVALMIVVGAAVGMTTIIKADDIPDLAVGIFCTLGFGSFLGGFIILLKG